MGLRKLRILVATSIHLPNDQRIMRQLDTLCSAGHDCTLVAPWAGVTHKYQFRTRFFARLSGLRGRLRAQFMFLRASLCGHWDIIHFHDFDLTLAGILVRLITWQCVVYDVHENYGEEFMVRGNVPSALRIPIKHAANIIEWLACHIIRNLVVVVPAQQERFGRWGCPHVILVRNFAPSAFAPVQEYTASRPHVGSYVLNTGSQTIDYGALTVVGAASLLKGQGLEIPLRGIDRFEGSPGLREKVVSQIKNEHLDYLLLPRVAYQELGGYLKGASIGLSPILDTSNKRLAYPTKLFEYMAYGVPIIASDVGYQAEIVKASGAGVIVPPGDSEALANAIVDLWQNAAKRESLGRAGRMAFFSTYCWEPEGQRLLDYYRAIAP